MPIPSSAGSWRHPLLSTAPLRLPKLNFDLCKGMLYADYTDWECCQRKLRKITNACGRMGERNKKETEEDKNKEG
jgi:hypothetical protein